MKGEKRTMKDITKQYHIGHKVYYVGDLDKVGFVVKGKIVSQICKDFSNYNIKLSLIAEFSELCEDDEFYSNNNVNSKTMECFIKYIKTIIDQLRSEEKEIIINEFISPKENWWIRKYRRSTFFRYRLEAVNNFLNYVF